MKNKTKLILGLLVLGGLFFALNPHLVLAAESGYFDSIFGKEVCTYGEWFELTWSWIMTIIIPLSILMIAWAGFLWMTSSGNPDKIGKSKKIITGVVSGVLLLVFARVLIVNIIGLDKEYWNTKTSSASTDCPNYKAPAGSIFDEESK